MAFRHCLVGQHFVALGATAASPEGPGSVEASQLRRVQDALAIQLPDMIDALEVCQQPQAAPRPNKTAYSEAACSGRMMGVHDTAD